MNICGVVCVQLTHFSLGDWEDISIAHVIIIIKSEVSTLPIIIFFRGCVSEMFVISYSVTSCIYIPGKPGFRFHYYCAVYDECKYSDTFWLADRVHLFVHYTISLSSLCKLIWRHWTYLMPIRYILSSVWVRLSIFSQLSIVHYMGLCVFSFPISLVMTERIYTLSYNHQKSEVWTLIHGHETMVRAVCLSIFLPHGQSITKNWTSLCIYFIIQIWHKGGRWVHVQFNSLYRRSRSRNKAVNTVPEHPQPLAALGVE